MCKTSKSSQSAAASNLPDIQPNAGGGGGNGGGGGGPMVQYIAGDHVPELTFISSAALDPTTNASNDRFLQSAVWFHTFHGLKPTRFGSFEELIINIAKLTTKTHIGRFRLVTHAFSSGILAPFCKVDPKGFLTTAERDEFKSENSFLEKDEVKAFLKSDADWFIQAFKERHLLFSNNSKDVAIAILTHIKTNGANASALAPFGFNDTFSNLSKPLEHVILGSLSEQLINGNQVKREATPNAKPLTAAHKPLFMSAFNTIQAFNKTDAVAKSNGAFNLQAVNALETAVKSFTLADYLINLPSGVEVSLEAFAKITSIQIAINAGIRATLDTVRQKLDTTSFIDIRGCTLGSDTDFMNTLQKLFGQANALPHMSAPKIFQAFPQQAFKHGDRTFIDNLITNGFTDNVGVPDSNTTESKTVSANDFVKGFEPWFKAIAYDQAYFDFFKTLLGGTALNFCAMAWKATFPALKIKGGFQQDWKTFAFEKIIPELKKVCGVAGNAQPTTATITALKPFVTTDIPAHLPKLTQDYSANLNQGLTDLKAIVTALGASIPDPSPLQASTLKEYQTKIIDFINTNKLKHIKTLMDITKQIVEGANPKIQLMLHLGVPCISFFPDGIPDLAGVNEEPDVRTSNIVALTRNKDTALRLFLKSQWVEDLPTAASANSATLGSGPNGDSPLEIARQVAALSPSGSEVDMFTCPMPDYMKNIVSV